MYRAALRLLLLVFALGSFSALSSCASDESNTQLRRRLDRGNQEYYERQQRRKIRQDARRDRYHMWYDRIMGR